MCYEFLNLRWHNRGKLMQKPKYGKQHLHDDKWIVIDLTTGEEATVKGVKYGPLIELEAERYASTLNWLDSNKPIDTTAWNDGGQRETEP